MEAAILVLIIIASVVLFVTQIVRIEVTSLFILAALSLTGILGGEDVLSGFSSPATITVGAMLVLSAGVAKAGVADYAAALLQRWAGTTQWGLLLALGVTVSFFSAFINNTAIVAITVPIVLTLCQRTGRAPSKFLLPVSYFAIMGGTCTLIGTSTNIIVASISRSSGGPPVHMFEFTKMGLLCLLAGIACILPLARFLPTRTTLGLMLSPRARSQFVSEVEIPPGSRHAGKAVGELLKEIRILEIFRGDESLLWPAPDHTILAGDILLIEGSAKAIGNLMDSADVAPATVVADDERVTIRQVDRTVTELVITPASRFVGQRVKDIGLRRRHGIVVLAARRLGVGHHMYGLRKMALRPGDVLLVQGSIESLRDLQEGGDVLLVEGIDRTMTFPHRAPWAVGILSSVVVLAALDVAPLVALALLGVALMLMTRCLTVAEATRALDSSVLFLLAGTIPLGVAMNKTGIAHYLAENLVRLAGGHELALVGGFCVLTGLLTEIVSNNATAALLTPVALAVASTSGVNPKAMLMAIIFGASSSFATPQGYQTNAMVMGAGGYLVRDYLRVGLPLKIVILATAIALIPLFWQLRAV
ncbi:SLC13 family permease [Candidatus Fermentibacteria bacterium]|nr:SLC13 family permease [Candidatus Fermentibacteria bacterium]